MSNLATFHKAPCATCGHRDKHSDVSGCIHVDMNPERWCDCEAYVAPAAGAPRPARAAKARTTDPSTSHAAAASITEDTLRESHTAVLGFLREYGPLTDVDLVIGYTDAVGLGMYPRQSQSGIRSRRAELVAAGLVEDTGERTRLASGRQAIVWAAKEAQA